MGRCINAGCFNEQEMGEIYCTECLAVEKEYLELRIKEGLEEGCFEFEDAILCPYCGSIQSCTNEDGDHNEEGDHDIVCDECCRIFRLVTEIVTEFSTYKVEDLDDSEEDDG